MELYWQSSSRPTEWILGTAVADGMGRLNMADVPGPSARVQARWTRSGRVSVGTSEEVAIGGEGDAYLRAIALVTGGQSEAMKG